MPETGVQDAHTLLSKLLPLGAFVVGRYRLRWGPGGGGGAGLGRISLIRGLVQRWGSLCWLLGQPLPALGSLSHRTLAASLRRLASPSGVEAPGAAPADASVLRAGHWEAATRAGRRLTVEVHGQLFPAPCSHEAGTVPSTLEEPDPLTPGTI